MSLFNKTMIDLDTVLNKQLRMVDVAEDVDLHVRVVSKTEVIYQFVSTGEDPSDPEIKTTLQVGYDDFRYESDWYFEDAFGGKFYLNQFEPITG